jgi:hypothetical protein
MLRDENRCEGIKNKLNASGGMQIISLTTSAITAFDEELHLQIPKLSVVTTDVSVRSLAKRYQLDNIKFKSQADALTFSWSTYVLKKANIDPKDLRVLAYFLEDSQAVFVPVTIGKYSGEYKFVLYSNSPAEISTFQIIRHSDGKRVYKSSKEISQGNEIIFIWKPGIARKGRYKLNYVAEIQQIGKSPERYEKTILFEHNPAGLK